MEGNSEAAAAPAAKSSESTGAGAESTKSHQNGYGRRGGKDSYHDSKRKRYGDDSLKHGGRGGKRRDMGRKEYEQNQTGRRERVNQEKEKRAAQGDKPNSVLPAAFARDEIDAEDRRPKRKVAVLIGYSGTGYKGMQISPTEKTIEGDLFTAFVKAGAISKANADDPKKSALVRCARTDKGVHAAGNMISLKLIIEDSDIVEKINSHLSPQIRVWGIERTIGSFSCYQACDSRWYEYLIPSHAFLPPHPSSWLGKKLVELADEAEDTEQYESRQEEVKDFWRQVEETDIKPLVDGLDEDIRELVMQALYDTDHVDADLEAGPTDTLPSQAADMSETVKIAQPTEGTIPPIKVAEAAIIVKEPALQDHQSSHDEVQPVDRDAESTAAMTDSGVSLPQTMAPETEAITEASEAKGPPNKLDLETKERLHTAIKALKAAYNAAKRRYRLPPQRISRIQAALDEYIGTCNFHNYTVQKTFRDPSAKRNIKSFVANPTPILINGTEWMSLKVHGQSFMMHQIRKMVGMVALVVRCGCDVARIPQSYDETKFSIPKAPGLGLLLERPVFDTYNGQQAVKHDRAKLDFGKYEKELEAFKQREIYERIFREEESENQFHQFFNHIDNFRETSFLFLSSKGIEAAKGGDAKVGKGGSNAKFEAESDDEGGARGED